MPLQSCSLCALVADLTTKNTTRFKSSSSITWDGSDNADFRIEAIKVLFVAIFKYMFVRQHGQRGLIKNGKRLPQVPGFCRQSDYPAFSCAKLGRKKDSRNSLQKSKFKRRQKTSTKNSKGFKTLQKASKRLNRKNVILFYFYFFLYSKLV